MKKREKKKCLNVQMILKGLISCEPLLILEGGNNAPQEPYIQKARVVSTIVFFLE